MSKEAAQRAMREARYAERTAAAKTGGAAARTSRKAAAPVAPAPRAAPAPTADAGLCGHRSMNGRTCTREAGHAAKSHRYS
jgi:hypothetical protein